MSANYIIRLDDACPTMHHQNWNIIEELLLSYDIRPIVGVIPANEDSSMYYSAPDPHFWDRVRGWQQSGWEIALHGYNHVYHKYNSKHAPIIKTSDQSEFVGLSFDEQKKKIDMGLEIFKENGVSTRCFMAPSHSFDETTLDVLQETPELSIITDGFSNRIFRDHELLWIPQQLWKFRLMQNGLWCICLHPNTMSISELQRLSHSLKLFNHLFHSLDEMLQPIAKSRSLYDRVFHVLFEVALKLKSLRSVSGNS